MENNVVKNTLQDELIKEVNVVQAIATSNLAKKADYGTKINEIENKILDLDYYITTQRFIS